MAVSRALRRLLRIRELEEEQSRLALESSLDELHRLEHALTAAFGRERRGRSLVQISAQSGQLTDRLAGLEETRSARIHAGALEPRIDGMGEEVTERRQEFLMKRVERRQAETLIAETEAQEAIEEERRGQQSLDDWYCSRLYRNGNSDAADAEPAIVTMSEFASQGNPAVELAAKQEMCARKFT